MWENQILWFYERNERNAAIKGLLLTFHYAQSSFLCSAIAREAFVCSRVISTEINWSVAAKGRRDFGVLSPE